MNSVINSWKNSNVFQSQLSLNLKELSSENMYPPHWLSFLELVNSFQPKTILDVGCGCGAYYELCKRHLDIEYTGIDYAKEAIELAKKTWSYDNFIVKDYKELTSEYVQGFDLVHAGAMFDVLPNGDEALEFVMSLKPHSLLIGRMKLTDNESYYNRFRYIPYDSIETYEFYHNKNKFFNICLKYNYSIHQASDSFYMRSEK